MGSRMGTRLPMIFVKGHPAKLHEMTLDQLRKFVPFLVKCDTRKELPLSTDDAASTPPSWWPSKLPFSRSVLYEKRPQREMTQRLVRIVSRCYAEQNSSYLIAFSSSLAGGNCSSQTYGKLTMVELEDGTTRILNSKDQLVVVVRTTTRHYDREVCRQAKKRRRSARLVTLSTMSDRSKKKVEKLATNIKGSEQSPVVEDGASKNKKRRRNVERTCRKPHGVILSETNQRQGEKTSDVFSKGSKSKDKGRVRGQARPQRSSTKAIVKLPCKHCGKEFTYQEILEEHETQCSSSQDEILDVRDDESRKDDFMSRLGLVDVSSNLERQASTAPPVELREPLKPSSRNLRKVASRSKIGAILRAHPIPLTSERGQKLLEKFGERMKAGSLDGNRIEYERSCKSRNCRVPAGPAPEISTLKKHLIKETQYCHQFSFSKSERKRRDVELIVGMARKSFKLFNTCRDLSVVVERLPETTFQKYMEKRRKLLRSKNIKFEAIIKGCTPTINIVDCVKYPNSLPVQYRIRLKKKS